MFCDACLIHASSLALHEYSCRGYIPQLYCICTATAAVLCIYIGILRYRQLNIYIYVWSSSPLSQVLRRQTCSEAQRRVAGSQTGIWCRDLLDLLMKLRKLKCKRLSDWLAGPRCALHFNAPGSDAPSGQCSTAASCALHRLRSDLHFFPFLKGKALPQLLTLLQYIVVLACACLLEDCLSTLRGGGAWCRKGRWLYSEPAIA